VEPGFSQDKLQALVSKINEVQSLLEFTGSDLPKGYIFLKETASSSGNGEDGGGRPTVYDIFEPFLTKQMEEKPRQTYETFNEAVDEFYSSIECQKKELVKHQEKKSISSKLDKIKLDQESRINSLRNQALSTNKKAQLIEYNLASVDAAINAVNEAIASGFDWKELDQMIKSEQEAGNPVAQLVCSLQLERNSITLQLQNNLDDLDDLDEGEGKKLLKVQVDLGMTAHANACALYQQRKKHEKKENKTVEASQRVLKTAEKQANSEIKKLKVTASGFKIARKQFWFEKFDWFVSSENYLVVSGRDAQQNEMIVKRYLTKHDVYVHADIHGAASCIVRNRVDGGAIPPTTLLEAGSFCVCHSQAWNSKFTTGSWWVYSDQVSKTAPTGEYLQTGSFMIRGKKNFLQPTQLLMGYTMLFKLDEDSVESHLGERASKQEENADDVGNRVEEVQEQDAEEILEEGGECENEDDNLFSVMDTSVALNVSGEEEYEQIGVVSNSKSGYTMAKERQKMKEAQQRSQGGNKQTNEGAPKKSVRGKHGKKKKMKKYADQDDEDRELAMLLLGNPGGKKKNAKEEKESATGGNGRTQEDSSTKAGPVAESEPKDVSDENVSGKGDKVDPSGAGRQSAESSVVVQQYTHDGDVDILNSLTGLPREDDIMLFCVPMCAPYSAIMNYKYKVKVQPGNLRKGKAAKAAFEMLVKTHEPPQREYELLKSIPEQELVAAMVGNSKPSVSFRRGAVKGLSKATQGGKKKGKGGKGGKGGKKKK